MKRILAWGVAGVVFVAAVGFGIWLFSLPDEPQAATPVATSPQEAAATLQALRPSKTTRPLIAILGANGGTETETTDYVMPYGILRRADVADVIALATHPGPVKLYPALQAEPDATITEFDAQHPEGADYVIVPAMNRDDDRAVLEWLRGQVSKGATIISVCAGAKVVAAAGLLDGRRATTHWYYRADMLDAHPSIEFVRNRRYVVDGKVATTTGVTASMPMMLALIEAISGREKAESVANDLGVSHWDARHDTDAFIFSRPFATTVLANAARFWNHESMDIPLESGVDEVSLALVADAWSRTYRSKAETSATGPGPVITRSGLRILPDKTRSDRPAARQLKVTGLKPAQALDDALMGIGAAYGPATSAVVAAQLEYPARSAFR